MNNSLIISSGDGDRLRYEGFIFNLKPKYPAFEEALEKYSNVVGKIYPDKEEISKLETAPSREIFVVHGHDDGVKNTVARFLDRLKLTPIILHERPNKGRTLIEKFEDYANVSFAIVIMTADDEGKANTEETFSPRARQNVVFEQGFFFGRLGRGRVCALYAEGVDPPSDISGIVYIPLDRGEAWKNKLATELRAAGLEIDMNLL